MNTQKQITLMVALLFVLLGGCGAYTLYDQNRENSALASQQNTLAERGARLFARYCRQCHGNAGEGRIGPMLNRPELQDPNTRDVVTTWVTDTITCGRIGKIMPPWAQSEGGALNEEQIRDLVTLITTNAGDGWKKAGEFSAAENKVAPVPSVADVLTAASITGASAKVCGQMAPATETPGAESSSGAPPAGVTPSNTQTEVATDNKFSLTAMAVNAGQPVTVTFQNRGAAIHNWAIVGSDGKAVKDDAGKDIALGLIPAGQQANITFTLSKPGVYNFLCEVHPTEMTGKLYIAAPSATAITAPTQAAGGNPASGTAPQPAAPPLGTPAAGQ